MQTNCVEMPLDAIHVTPRLLSPSLRCIVHTIFMLRLPHDSSPGEEDFHSTNRSPHVPQPPLAAASSRKYQTHAETREKAKVGSTSEAAAASRLHRGADRAQRRGPSSLCASPSTNRSNSMEKRSNRNSAMVDLQLHGYPKGSSLLEVNPDELKWPRGSHAKAPEGPQGIGDALQRLPKGGGSNCRSSCSSSSSGNSSSSSNSGSSSSCNKNVSGRCSCTGGHPSGRGPVDLRLHPHASPPLSLIYLRLCEAPHLTEEVERKLRAFTGIVESSAGLQQQQQQAAYTLAVVLYIQRPKAFGFLPSSVERVSFERWLLPISICWCTQSCSSCCYSRSKVGTSELHERSSSCCCGTTQCCQARQIGSRRSCNLAAAASEEAPAPGSACRKQHAQQRSSQYLPRELRQQQEVEKAVRRVLFAIVELTAARQFHLPPPSVSHHLYGYDLVLSSNQASLLGDWALQLPQSVRLL
ncbi:hypothetical protein, conserved [Eimeria tenella]|uniref:Uncharacterized protein n=1 Tax=Eimeria tenella TaxID=5802 RepID=U6KMT7_EIMTE|nr:hypothetical protein, conserved [Eimeria tenella]CDJ38136.1 hypothetical protein, conserved [Eimeria tenella]|eukprot:XP_013228974.1 hypothetical protein, conserved [Eimeria tenella]